jgi:diguanylate cyclase (GGDEF)-like protein/PAS domain S-box-containing protein
MTTPPDDEDAALRDRAEAAVAKMAKPIGADSADATHELLVHQVELEMQNEELRRLQASLEAERTRYFELFNLAPVGYVTLDAKNLITEANLTSAHQFGLPREKLAKRPFSRVILPADQDVFYLARKSLPATGTPLTCELRLLKADGTSFWARLEISAVSSAGGETGYCRLSITDITERVKAREDLARREQEYRLLAENASDVVFRCSMDGLIEWITSSVTARAGWTPEQIVGRNFRDFVHPDDTDRLAAGQAGLKDGIGFEVELRIRIRTDGYHWFSVSMRPVLDDAGTVTHLVGGWQDIQNMVQTRSALEMERARLRATLDSLLDPHVMLEAVRNKQGRIIDFLYADANEAACQYNKMERIQLVGRRLLELLPAHTSTGLLDLYRHTLESDEPLVLNDFVYPHEILAQERRFDIRAIRVGDALSFTWRDVTDRYQLTQRLAASEEHYRLLTTNSYDTAIRVADDGTVLWISPSIKELLGWNPSEWIGRPVTEFVAPESLSSLRTNLERVVHGEPVVARYRALAKDGSAHWAESRATPYLDTEGRRQGILAAFHLINEQVAMEQELERRARTDELTSLLNRKEVFERIEAYGGKHPRTGQAIAVLFCDMDKFKTVNDTYGHAAGDEVLRVMADRIRRCLRSTDDLGARVGGDELLVVLHGVQDLQNAVTVAEKLRASAAEPISIPGGTVNTTVSIGVTLARPGEKTEALVARADDAMYRAKQTGRNQVISIDSEPAPDSPPR